MAGRTALFVARDASNNGTTPVGARLALGGLLAGNGASPLDVRAGVLVDNGGAIVSGAANMSYNVRAFRAVSIISAANGPTVGVNDATVNVVTTAAPGSNSRYDLIWARQHHVTGDGATDADVVYEIGVTQGTVAASPTIPAAPAGAIGLYAALVTAGVTATSGLTYTRVHVWTVANGGVIPVLTSGERSAITPYAGMVIWYSPAAQLQVWNGTAWVGVGTGQANPILVRALDANVSTGPSNAAVTLTTWNARTPHNQPGTGFFSYSAGLVTCTKAGMYRVHARVKWAANSTGFRIMQILLAGVIVAENNRAESPLDASQEISQILSLTAGQTIAIAVRQNSGGTLNVLGDPANLISMFTIEYLGAAAA